VWWRTTRRSSGFEGWYLSHDERGHTHDAFQDCTVTVVVVVVAVADNGCMQWHACMMLE
jgi:hypothetical protein